MRSGQRAWRQRELAHLSRSGDIDHRNRLAGNTYLEVGLEQTEVAHIGGAAVGRKSDLVRLKANGDFRVAIGIGSAGLDNLAETLFNDGPVSARPRAK